MRDVGERSGGSFKPTSVAGYERGERAISLQRFCELAEFYEVPPERLLAEIVRRVRGEPEVVIDVSALEAHEGPDAAAVARFVEEVQAVRGERASEVHLRIGDLQVLSTALGRSEAEVVAALSDALAHRE